MSEVKGYESDSGTMQYFPKKQKCQCCHKEKKRTEFIIKYNNTDDDHEYSMSYICNTCREPFAMPTNKMSFNGRGKKGEDISKPSIIDWMYQNANS